MGFGWCGRGGGGGNEAESCDFVGEEGPGFAARVLAAVLEPDLRGVSGVFVWYAWLPK